MQFLPSNSRVAAAATLLGVLAATGCQPAADLPPPADGPAAATGLLPAAPDGRACGDDGRLVAELHGELRGEIAWQSDEFECEGMPRPEGAGARLRFAGHADDGTQLAFIIAIPDLGPGEAAADLASNVTVIEEERGRFFSTPTLDACWTDVELQQPIDAGAAVQRIDGALYCIVPLPEVNGDSSVSLPELRFSGVIDWESA